MSERSKDRWIAIGLGCIPAVLTVVAWLAVLGNDRAYALERLNRLEQRTQTIVENAAQDRQAIARIETNVQWIRSVLETPSPTGKPKP